MNSVLIKKYSCFKNATRCLNRIALTPFISQPTSTALLPNYKINNRSKKVSNEQIRDFRTSSKAYASVIEFPPGNPLDKPKLEHLLFIKDNFTIYLKEFFEKTHPYAFYTPDVVFENMYFDEPKIFIGVLQYAMQLSSIRLKARYNYKVLKVDILKVTCDEAESSIVFRWRITGALSFSFKSMFLTPLKLLTSRGLPKTIEVDYYDGISTFYLRGDGRIVKHRVERVMTQKDLDEAKEKSLKKLSNLNVNTA